MEFLLGCLVGGCAGVIAMALARMSAVSDAYRQGYEDGFVGEKLH